jgi:hypothetical protein
MNYKLKKRQMKKLMILSTILLLGISSVFAQGAYDVVVPDVGLCYCHKLS